MDKIDVYNNSFYILNHKKNKYIFIYSCILSIVMFLILLICIFYNYNKYLLVQSTVVGDRYSYHLKLLMKEEELILLDDNLYIEEEFYNYDLLEIGDYVYDQNYNKYREVMIDLNFDSEKIVNNNIIYITLKLPKTTFYKQFIKSWKENFD